MAMVFIVLVLMGVYEELMLMPMLVIRAERHGDTERGQHRRAELYRLDVLAEHCPGDCRADEGGGGEDHLPAGGPELLSPSNPQRDRRAVTERTHDERAEHGEHR